MQDKHPLKAYLDDKSLKAWRFAADKGIPPRNLYALLSGENQNPSMDLMRAIEEATDGEVTVQRISDWTGARKSAS